MPNFVASKFAVFSYKNLGGFCESHVFEGQWLVFPSILSSALARLRATASGTEDNTFYIAEMYKSYRTSLYPLAPFCCDGSCANFSGLQGLLHYSVFIKYTVEPPYNGPLLSGHPLFNGHFSKYRNIFQSFNF